MSEKFTAVLPKNWDGRFPFTNKSDEDFVFVWAKQAYLFPANTQVDMMKMAFNATPTEVQQIRKFAAKRLAEREFFKSPEAKHLESFERNPMTGAPVLTSFQSARGYSEKELESFVQDCLAPFPEGEALISSEVIEPNTMDLLKRDDQGELVNKPIENTTKSLDPGAILLN